jgi:DnaD/phage-associated family protein
MKTFSGFPSGKVSIVGLPRPVFTDLVPLIDDLAELKLTLHVLWRLRQQRGQTRYLRLDDLAADEILLSSLEGTSQDKDLMTVLRSALSRAVERGTLLRVEPPDGTNGDALFFANTPKGRRAAKVISGGEWPDEVVPHDRPNIFTLYEQNIGMLTPLIADELRDAEQAYPPSWIEEAFQEAVNLNKRSWKYIRAILERWSTEGKDDAGAKPSPDADRRRYLEWKHG